MQRHHLHSGPMTLGRQCGASPAAVSAASPDSRPDQSGLFAEMMDRNDVPNERFYRALLSVRCIRACTLSGVAGNSAPFSAAIDLLAEHPLSLNEGLRPGTAGGLWRFIEK